MFGDFQSLKPNPDEHRIQPIEASHLVRDMRAARRARARLSDAAVEEAVPMADAEFGPSARQCALYVPKRTAKRR